MVGRSAKGGATADTVNGCASSPISMLRADPKFTGRVTVPVLWDKERRTIVNNEFARIIRMFNSAFDAFTDVRTDYYPARGCAPTSIASTSGSTRA